MTNNTDELAEESRQQFVGGPLLVRFFHAMLLFAFFALILIVTGVGSI